MKNLSIAVLGALGLALLITACASDGQEGEPSLDCSGHGTTHNGHCHCDSGYLFDGTTCVVPADIDAVCAAEETPATTDEAQHEHLACRCPASEECPCDHGEVQTFENEDYCVPSLDEE